MAMEIPSKRTPLRSLTISLTDVSRIFERLLAIVQEEGDRVLGKWTQLEEQTESEFEKNKEEVKSKAFRITVTIAGADGASVMGDTVDIFRSPNLPNIISYIYMTNVTAYQALANVKPDNSFELMLDFSKPALLDANNPTSAPTANQSILTLSGSTDSWIGSISEAVMGVLKDRKTRRNWIHREFIYDAGLFLIALPVGIYACWRSSGIIEDILGSIHPFISAIAYIYIVFLTLYAYRFLFGYTRWAFPTVELSESENAAQTHRAVWYLIIVSVVVAVASQTILNLM